MFRSEEDNDPLTDDAHSAISVPIAISRHSSISNNPRNSHLRPSSVFRGKHHLAHNLVSDSDAGVDSPTYDGDIESSTTAGADTLTSHKISYHHHSASSNSTINTTPNPTPSIEPSNPISLMRSTNPASHHPVFISPPMNTNLPPQTTTDAPAAAEASVAAFNPAALTPEDIQSFVAKAIAGESKRGYKINPPPVGRPVRIYADGMFRPPFSFHSDIIITQ
jgi:choline-phosphate cytidylyltransferase